MDNSVKHKIYFNEADHRYYDDFNNPFTSVTTIIHKYQEQFDTELMAKRCYMSGLRGNKKYAGKSIKQIKAEWVDRNKRSLDIGNRDHDYLEEAVKVSGNYHKGVLGFGKERIYTIEDVLDNKEIGIIDLKSDKMLDVKEKYPMVYLAFEMLKANGYRILSEVGVFNLRWLVSGLIDILAIKDNEFKIVDWKTNNDPIRFEGGYWGHDENYNITEYVKTYKKLLSPIDHLDDSIGNLYTLQLSTYARLLLDFGLTCTGITLFHIKKHNYLPNHPDINSFPNMASKRQLDIIPISFIQKDIEKVLDNHVKTQRLDMGHKLLFGN